MSKELEVKVPSFFNVEDFDSDAINIDIKDKIMSELKLAHEAKEGLEIGDYFDSVTKRNYGSEVEIIVLKNEKNWLAFNDNFDLEKFSSDGKYWDDGRALTEDESWRCIFYKFYILVRNDLTVFPLFLSFSSKSSKTGKSLLNFLDRFKEKKEPPYLRTYILNSQQLKKGPKIYCVKTIYPGEFTTDKEYKHARKVYNLMKGEKEKEKEEIALD